MAAIGQVSTDMHTISHRYFTLRLPLCSFIRLQFLKLFSIIPSLKLMFNLRLVAACDHVKASAC